MKKAYFLEADDYIKRGDFVRPLFNSDGWGPDSFHIDFRPIGEDHMHWWIGSTLGELNSMKFKYEIIRWA